MSVVATPKRTKLSQLQSQQAALLERRAELEAFIAGSPGREATARADEIRNSPHVLPGATSSVQKERRKRDEAERGLESTNANLEVIAQLIAEQEAELQIGRRNEIDKELRQHQDAIRERYRALAARLADTHTAWIELVDEVEALDAFREGAEPAEVFGNGLEDWRRSVAHLVVEPAAGNFEQVIHDLWQLMADPGTNGYRDSARYDDWNELRHLTPDLRGQTRRLQLTRGNEIVRYSKQ